MIAARKTSFLLCLATLCLAGSQTVNAGPITASIDASITDADTITNINYAVASWNALLPLATTKWSDTITFKSADLMSGGTAGATGSFVTDGNGRLKSATVTINSTATAGFYTTATPSDNSAFAMAFYNLRTNPAAAPDFMNSGIKGDATLAAAKGKWDMLSVLEHEIGHALGVGTLGTYTQYSTWVTNGGKISDAYKVFFPSGMLPVLTIPTTPDNGSNGDPGHWQGRPTATSGFNDALLSDPGWQPGQRDLISCLDLFGVASINGLAVNDIDPACVPEPSSFILTAFALSGMAGGAWRRWRQRRAVSTGQLPRGDDQLCRFRSNRQDVRRRRVGQVGALLGRGNRQSPARPGRVPRPGLSNLS